MTHSDFPVQNQYIYLNNCGVAPTPHRALQQGQDFLKRQSEEGMLVFRTFSDPTGPLRDSAARLFSVSTADISFVKNTAEALSMIANGYPIEPGDEILSYVHEYPSNHYPWKLQEHRGAKFVTIPEASEKEFTGSFRMEDLFDRVTDRTRIIALSHVQFTGGAVTDLKALGSFCKERGIDLIVDAAQSAGSMPLYPEEWNIQAVASSGWKWLLGPTGSGVLYTNPDFRAKIQPVLTGPGLMTQADDYLNHTWQPHKDGRFFEYSTPSLHNALILGSSIDTINEYGIENVHSRILQLQDRFLAGIDRNRYTPVLPVTSPEQLRSGILSFRTQKDPVEIMKEMATQNLVLSSRGGFLRVAPHFYNTEEEIDRAVDIMNG